MLSDGEQGRVPICRVVLPSCRDRSVVEASAKGTRVIILGVILLIVGFLAHISILWTIGIILVVIGLILFVLGMAGRAVGGRKHYY